VGVYNGRTAVKMIETASISHPPDLIRYHGFDLFEQLTDQDLESELSKRPPTKETVSQRLQHTGARIQLHQGFTADTIPQFTASGAFDSSLKTLIFLDGGHSVKTIAEDWKNLQPCFTPNTVVIMDDYYPEPDPAIEGMGCQKLVNAMNEHELKVEVLSPMESFQKDWGTLSIRMVLIGRR
jgi:hypothetical protein